MSVCQSLPTSSPCAAEKSILGCGRDRADIHRSLSLLRKRNATITTTKKKKQHYCATTDGCTAGSLQRVSAEQQGFI